MFDNLIKYLSLITIGTFTLGYAYLFAYYRQFNIDILNYITGQEIFYVFLKPVLFIFTIGTVALMWIRDERPKKTKTVQTLSQLAIGKGSWLHRPLPKWLTIVIILMPVCFIIWLQYDGSYFSINGSIVLIFSIILYLFFSWSTIVWMIENGKLKHSFLIYTFIWAGCVAFSLGKANATSRIMMGNSECYYFKANNVQYVTGSKYILIGETQTTVFLYNRTDSSSFVLRRVQIDSLVIRHGK